MNECAWVFQTHEDVTLSQLFGKVRQATWCQPQEAVPDTTDRSTRHRFGNHALNVWPEPNGNRSVWGFFFKISSHKLNSLMQILLLLLLLLLLLVKIPSPLCRVFTHIFHRQTMSLSNTMLQLFCRYCLWCPYH
jgi:hypothetical protein